MPQALIPESRCVGSIHVRLSAADVACSIRDSTGRFTAGRELQEQAADGLRAQLLVLA